MYRGGHFGFNALLYAPFAPVVTAQLSIEFALWGAVLAAATATLPDVDERTSRIAHRGPTHTLWFAALVGALAGALTTLLDPSIPTAGSFGYGFVVGTAGVLAHLAGDVLTPMGIRPLWPLTGFHVTLDLFKSKNTVVNRVMFIVGAVATTASVAVTLAVV